MRLPLVFIVGAACALAQYALWIDLSGNWKLGEGDRPEFASPEFDDRSWPAIALPRGYQYSHGTKYWLRRRIDLPESADRSQLALTLGALQDVYEVYINGRRVGATGSFENFSDARIPRPLTFDIPAGVVRDGGSLLVALRVRGALYHAPVWSLPDAGPYVLSYRAQAPVLAGRQQLSERWIAISPTLVLGAISCVLGVLSLLGWLGERERRELLWFSSVSFSWGITSIYSAVQLLADAHPYNRAGLGWVMGPGNLSIPLFAEFVFAVRGGRSWRWRWALWLGWCMAPLSLLADNFASVRTAANTAVLWSAGVGLASILWDWWRRNGDDSAPGSHLLRIVLLFYSLSVTAQWVMHARFLLGAEREATYGLLTPHFQLGPFRVEYESLLWLLVSATILALLFLRLSADRREKQRLAGEVEAARVIQQLLLGRTALQEPDLALEAVYTPAQEVGGDFYYVLDERVVVLGDVSGKGLRAAMVVSLLIGVLRDTHERRPAAVLAALNRGVTGQINGFVTCCCARFDPDGSVAIANAGHIAPYVDGVGIEVETDLPLGLDPEAEYGETVVALRPGACLTLLSDGVVEAENSLRELFGFERTREISTKSAREIAEAAKAWGQNDDITVVTVRRSGS